MIGMFGVSSKVTAGPRADVETNLYLDALSLDCSSPNAGNFSADLVIDPSGAVGNQCAAGAVGAGACAVVTAPGGMDADSYLYQVAVYRGFEQLQSGGAPAQKAYWNVALGVKRRGATGPGIEDCWLETRGTADDVLGTSVADHGAIAAGAVYPYVDWQVALASCRAEPLTFGDSAAMVRTDYTQTSGAGATFAYGSDIDRYHFYGDVVGLAYYENGYTNDCYYSTSAAKKLFGRIQFRE